MQKPFIYNKSDKKFCIYLNEYDHEYRDLEMLKYLYIENNFEQSEGEKFKEETSIEKNMSHIICTFKW